MSLSRDVIWFSKSIRFSRAVRSSNIPDGSDVSRLLRRLSVCKFESPSNIPDGNDVSRLLRISSVCKLESPLKSPDGNDVSRLVRR